MWLFFGVLEAAGQDFDSELESQQRGGYPKKPYAQNRAILQVSSVTFDGNATRTSTAGVALFARILFDGHAELFSAVGHRLHNTAGAPHQNQRLGCPP